MVQIYLTDLFFIIIIIIYPLTAKVIGAPQMISQPVSSIFSLFSTALWDLTNSRPVHSLMLSSHLFLCPPKEKQALQERTGDIGVHVHRNH